MGSASTIQWTGPSVLLAYAISGIFIFFIMRAMGEMLYVEPSTGSFATFGYKYIHPLAGYLTAWSNWFQWVIVGMSEIIAVGTCWFSYWCYFKLYCAGKLICACIQRKCTSWYDSMVCYSNQSNWIQKSKRS